MWTLGPVSPVYATTLAPAVPEPGGYGVRQRPGLHPEAADAEACPRNEVVQPIGVVQHSRPVESADPVERVGRREYRQRGRRLLPKRPRPQQRVQIGTVVRMPVAEQRGVDPSAAVHSSGRGSVA